MLYNGLGSWNETLNNAYTTTTSAPQDANMRINYGRKSGNAATGGPGICPANWHVPTEYEWAILLDKTAGSGTTFVAQNYIEWAGEDNSSGVGAKLKSVDYCASGTCAADDNQLWNYHAKMSEASDLYGFRGLPAGFRSSNGSDLRGRGYNVFYWSSSVYSAAHAWRRGFYYSRSDAYRYNTNRSYGFSVRCVRD